MAYDQSQRQMVQGNWTCSGCGGTITELPFEPDPSRLDSLLCRDCHRQKREERRGGSGGGRSGPRPDRQMYKGDWKCSGCGAAITELPFQPDPARSAQLKCRDCYRQR